MPLAEASLITAVLLLVFVTVMSLAVTSDDPLSKLYVHVNNGSYISLFAWSVNSAVIGEPTTAIPPWVFDVDVVKISEKPTLLLRSLKRI